MPTIVTDVAHLKALVARTYEHRAFAFDVETMGTDRETGADIRLVPRRNTVVWIGIATQGLSYVIPIGHPHGRQVGVKLEPRLCADGKTRNYKVPDWGPAPKQLRPAQAFEVLEPLFYTEGILKIGCNIKFDLESCQKYYDDEVMPGPFFDVQVAAHMLNENQHTYRLGDLIKREFGFTYDKKLGERIEKYSFHAVARYNNYDAKYTWMLEEKYGPLLTEDDLDGLWKLEMDLLEVLLYMEQQGALLDQQRAEVAKKELGIRLDRIRGDLFRLAGGKQINFRSAQQMQNLLYGKKGDGGLGLKVKKLTRGGKTGENKKPSTSKEALELYQDHPFVAKYLEMGDVGKIHGTYLTAYLGGEVVHESGGRETVETKPSILINGKLHANFKQHGTVTGRFSCVSGDSLVRTTRGDVRIDTVLVGDNVLTHEGRWRLVTAVYDQGVRETVRLHTLDGLGIFCTADHKILTPLGWREAGDLAEGDEVCVGQPRVGAGREERQASDEAVLARPRQADDERDRAEAQDDVRQRAGGALRTTARRGPRAEGAALLTVEDRCPQPDDWQDGCGAPWVQGGGSGRVRLPAAQGRGSVFLRAPSGDGEGARDDASRGVGRAPHRRGQAQQPTGQPRSAVSGGAREAAPAREASCTAVVSSVTAGPTQQVWDIGVDEDHSFVCNGYVVHNCSEPNLQNIPRPDGDLGALIRGLFIAPPGHSLVVADYGQIEYIVMAHLSRDPMLVRAFKDGVDLHQFVAAMVFNKPMEEISKTQRTTAKNTNFAVAYGAGTDKVAAMSGITLDAAEKFRYEHRRMLPTLYRWTERVVADARNRRPPHVTTMLGRKRRLPALVYPNWYLRSEAERQAVNTVVQGSAADLIKLAMVRLHRLCDEELRLSLSVHDELVLVVPDDRVADGQEVMQEAMLGEGIQRLLSVPMKIDMHVVKRWSEAKA